jgi:hypothetical protein
MSASSPTPRLPLAWMVTRDSDHEPPEFFLTEQQARLNASLGQNKTRITPLFAFSENASINADAFECLRRLIAKHTKEPMPSITPERLIEIVRAGMEAVKAK